MKRMIIVILLALVSGISGAVVVGSGHGPNDIQVVATGVAIVCGLLAVAIPLVVDK